MAKRQRTTEALFAKAFSVVSECPAATNGLKLIGTHDGTFHCDEALGCAMLQMMPQWAGSTIVRTRNLDELAKCDIVIDVGAVYDHSIKRYDHHQRTFTSVLSDEHPDVSEASRPKNFSTKLSACGLVYKHYGLTELLPTLTEGSGLPTSLLPTIYKKMYKGFVEEVDAIDNGVDIAGDAPLLYKMSTNLSARVGHLNPAWNEEGSKARRNALFADAMELTGGEFKAALTRLTSSWWPARAIVEAAMDARTAADASGQILLLEQYAPWQGHLGDLEAERGLEGHVLYTLFPDSGGSWRVQAVAKEGFTSRKALPSTWRGVRDADLSAVAGIDGCVFCHNAGFIGGNATKEGALKMAKAALAFVEEPASAANGA